MDQARLLLLILVGVLVSPALGQTVSVTYVLEDVFFVADESHPGSTAQRHMTGTYVWTYEIGDFENGAGELIGADIPYWGSDMSEIETTMEVASIEMSLGVSYHDLGVDVQMFTLVDLDPDAPSPIDTERSSFQVEQGIIWRGHIVSGSIVPESSLCDGDANADGVIDVNDISFVLFRLGEDPPVGDANGDGVVDVNDISHVLFRLGNPCG